MKQIHIIGGGTVSHIRNHLALTAPAYGFTARAIYSYISRIEAIQDQEYKCHLHLTKMADSISHLETNEDISNALDHLIANPKTKIIFFNPALVDFDGSILTSGHTGSYEWSDDIQTKSGKYEERLKTSEGNRKLELIPAKKLVGKIRKNRKDIFLVAFKTTCGATQDEQFLTGLNLLKSNSCNLVLANDTLTRTNMIITPEQARYSVTTDRMQALVDLVEMTLSRAKGTFTRSTVVDAPPIDWNSDAVPASLRTVVNHCITNGAYKLFNGSTVGHFAYKLSDTEFVTSKRKTNFNELNNVGMVRCVAKDVVNDSVIAYGAKPSVGGQSQRIVFKDHPDSDCIVHFHCPPKATAQLSVRLQKDFECGSHECGKNTSAGLREESSGIKCVYLDNHGPNIVFNQNIDPQMVIEFIDRNFDLDKSTDGVVRG